MKCRGTAFSLRLSPPHSSSASLQDNFMPQVPIIMPQLGESIAEATVISLLVKVGDKVNVDQDVIEVETNKAAMNVTSPCGGRVEKLLVKLNESYPVGAGVGFFGRGAQEPGRLGFGVSAPARHETARLA